MGVLSLIFVSLIAIQLHSTHAYKAKVFDSTPKQERDAVVTMDANWDDYLGRIDLNDDVVVLPEYGLTSLNVFSKENMTQYALNIPEPDKTFDICKQSKDSQFLSRLSCAAIEKNIYLLANLIEKDGDYFYNTNVVFSPTGALVAKYRKINLWRDENKFFKAGTKIVTFDTKFGTFGTFTCYDILFKLPALDIVAQENVTAILYPNAWFSQLPFHASLSVQDGFAKSTGINLLASSYNDPKNGNGGSGIYLGRKLKNIHINGFTGTAAVSTEINSSHKSRPKCEMMESVDTSPDSRGILINPAKQFKMTNSFEKDSNRYIHVPLKSDLKNFEEKLCTSDKKVCCDFQAKIFNAFSESDQKYKFVLYSKNGRYACGLVSCDTDDVSTCGNPNDKSSEINFVSLRIEARNVNASKYDFPATLQNTLKPIDSYRYCSSGSNVTIELEHQKRIVAFGIVFNGAANFQGIFFVTIICFIFSRII